ncbi:MAG: LexA repressor [Candidatus Omnitrophica bacterium]|nr:LexA repressor [Candidatus Omnitrophota bacterium]
MPRTFDRAGALKKLREFYRSHHRPPSFDEIRELFGYRSKNSAFWIVRRLIESGFLRKDPKGKLVLDQLTGVKLLGSVAAGFPNPAEEELVDTLNLDEYLIRHPEQTFLVKVTGDSMIDAGIHEGDLVLVERGRSPKEGDIVIAQVDREWTLKYYQKKAGRPVLVAANVKYPPIVPREELTVGGVVVAVVRKYK